jgi:hypothetical protein
LCSRALYWAVHGSSVEHAQQVEAATLGPQAAHFRFPKFALKTDADKTGELKVEELRVSLRPNLSLTT